MKSTEKAAASLIAGFLSTGTQTAYAEKAKAGTTLDRRTLTYVRDTLADTRTVRTLAEAREHVQRLFLLADEG